MSLQSSSMQTLSIPPIASTFPSAPAPLSSPTKIGPELLTSGLSVALANALTNPLDVIKVRMQQQAAAAAGEAGGRPALGRALPAAPGRGTGFLSTGITAVRSEGLGALWRSGLGPSVACGIFLGGARLGLYSPIKAALSRTLSMAATEDNAGRSRSSSSSNSSGFGVKVLSGGLSGGLAAAGATPVELIKTRLQAVSTSSVSTAGGEGGCRLGAPGGAPSSSMGIIRAVIATEGMAGLWKGATPAVLRLATQTACQCAAYDEVKRAVMRQTGRGDDVGTHLTSSMIAGLVTTTVTAPFDVVKARMFLAPAGQYSGPGAVARCAVDVLRGGGLGGFMRGWTAAYARLGPHTVIRFVVAERLRKMAGLQGL